MKTTRILLIISTIFLLLLACKSTSTDQEQLVKQTANEEDNIKTTIEPGKDLDKQAEKEEWSSWTNPKLDVYPITSSMFNSYYTGNEPIACIGMRFDKNIENFNEYAISNISQGRLNWSKTLSEFEFYKAGYYLKKTLPVKETCVYSTELPSILIEQIFDHLNENSDYFFSNTEFQELPQPYVTDTFILDWDKYMFSMSITNPGFNEYTVENRTVYCICKAEEEIEEGDPLYELFEIWETQIIPVLMQNLKKCE